MFLNTLPFCLAGTIVRARKTDCSTLVRTVWEGGQGEKNDVIIELNVWSTSFSLILCFVEQQLLCTLLKIASTMLEPTLKIGKKLASLIIAK